MFKCSKIMVILLSIIVMLTLTGCVNNLLTKEKTEEELIIRAGHGCHTYTYSEKVMVCIDTSEDSLDIRTGKNDDYYWETILEGEFKKVAWYDYNIFILKGDIYYVFDINSYEIPETISSKPKYVLKEYTESELVEWYPNCNSFDWYGY